MKSDLEEIFGEGTGGEVWFGGLATEDALMHTWAPIFA